MTKAIQYTQLGGPEVLSVAEIETPIPGPGEVLLRVEAAGVNPLDWKLRSGKRKTPPFDGPRGAGSDGGGVVIALGDGVEGLRVGQAVAFANGRNAYATEATAPANSVSPRPANVSAAEAAGIGIPAGTAYQVLRSMAIGSDDTLLIHGGSGSVGQALIQFAKLQGARVIATTSDRRADLVRSLGAEPVAYGPGLADRVRAIAPDGPTVIVDCAGTDEALETSVELLADRSRIATIVRGADAADLGIRAWMGGSPTPMTETELAWRREAIALTLALMAAGAFRIELGAEYALADAGQAQADSEAGTDGKLVILP